MLIGQMRNPELAKRLRTSREGAKLSQTRAAAALGVTANHLARVERHEKGISHELVLQAAQVYGVDAAWLLGLAGAPEPKGKRGKR
jgi:transcriptional regulator with XRE-family HTH domain